MNIEAFTQANYLTLEKEIILSEKLLSVFRFFKERSLDVRLVGSLG